MSSKGIGHRLGFKRTNTNQEPVTVTEVTNGEASGTTPEDADSNFHGVARELPEVESNRRLKHFRKDHAWDPNMPDEAIEMVDAVTSAHDAKGEAHLVGEIIENSPYPEVSDHLYFPAM